jgi:rhodanese-related sulfurtransferase
MAGLLSEALVVLVLGLGLALAANQVSPRGLALTRNYFPATTRHRDVTGSSPALSPVELLAARLKEQGLQLIDSGAAVRLFHDPRLAQGGVVFVDARDEAHYRQGHIPGAYEFDAYHPEKFFPTVLPPCQAAEQIVVYCHGGDCDDSESAALLLRDVGIATHKLLIYGDGITGWTTNHWPVETGERDSGKLNPSGP